MIRILIGIGLIIGVLFFAVRFLGNSIGPVAALILALLPITILSVLLDDKR